MLQHRLADALRDAALHLTDRQERVNHPPVIVDCEISFECHGAGFRVDLDLSDMCAGWEGDQVALVPDISAESRRLPIRPTIL